MTKKMLYKILTEGVAEGTKYQYEYVPCGCSDYIQRREKIFDEVWAGGYRKELVGYTNWEFVDWCPIISSSWYVNGCNWDEFCKMFPNKNY